MSGCFYITADNGQLGKLFLRKEFTAACQIVCRQSDRFIAEKMICPGNTACGNAGGLSAAGISAAVFKKDIAGIDQQGGKTFFPGVLFCKRDIAGFAGQTAQPIAASAARLIFAFEIIGKKQRELLRLHLRECEKRRKQRSYQYKSCGSISSIHIFSL